ncbi:MmgE/PrpD family protein [Candidimonas nitroreducens]|uniref:2-methylcitrate dehydratase n=1 Tax=Candidimonas nitroreducens TaxID=683354 RepID=A0A225MCS7_9BURK|nr:MmgE/PrpD family protein [Candidimonas nitroreducens]OWT59077.1 2-methylcitrate dehydratase [Candidimonas nitroreducens]
MTILREMAGWSAAYHNDNSAASSLAKAAIEDAVACMIAGAGDLAAAQVRASASSGSVGAALILGGGRTSPHLAALANGTAAHALDFDDVLIGASNHAGAVLASTLLALGDAHKCAGKDMVDAFVVGIHLCSVIAKAIMPGHYLRGWHTTSTLGCIGAAAAGARMLDCSEDEIAQAMAIAVSMAGGTKVQFGTPMKPLHAGLAAQSAVQSIELARAGLYGSAGVMEGKLGFSELFCHPDHPADWKAAAHFLTSDQTGIESPGLLFKRYPCCGSNSRVLDIVLDLQKKEQFEADEVAAVVARVSDVNTQNLMYDAPRDELQGRFSLQYAVAVALYTKGVTLKDFVPGSVDRPQIRALLSLTQMISFGKPFDDGDPPRTRPHTVEIRLKDGRTFAGECADPVGTVNNPFTEQIRHRKFFDCSSWVMNQDRIDRVRSLIGRLDTLAEISMLTRELEFHVKGDRGERFLRPPTVSAI